jgi:hypothetical protein
MKTGILALGLRRDAGTWEEQCRQTLGFEAPLPVRHPSPTLQQLRDFFRRPAEWLYFGGHFVRPELYNEASTVGVSFHADRVELRAGNEKGTLRKGTDEFTLDRSVRLILWGGCSTLSRKEYVAELNALFGPHLMLGFRRTTGIPMCEAMFTGGGFIKEPFFKRAASAPADDAACRDAWMGAALEGYGGSENEDRFAAVDPDGTGWILEKKGIKRSGKMF